jgi:hypothetical protein
MLVAQIYLIRTICVFFFIGCGDMTFVLELEELRLALHRHVAPRVVELDMIKHPGWQTNGKKFDKDDPEHNRRRSEDQIQ